MLEKHLKSSLRAKLLILTLCSIALIAIPTMYVTYNNIEDISIDFETKSFNNALTLINENITSNYKNFISEQFINVLERKKYLESITSIAFSIWSDFTKYNESGAEAELIGHIGDSIYNMNSFITVIEDNTPITNLYIFDLLTRSEDKTDFKGQPLVHLLKEDITPNGVYAVYNITKQDFAKYTPEVKDDSYYFLKKEFDTNNNIPILLYIFPANMNTLILTGSVLSDMQESAQESINQTVEKIQEKLNTLEFYPSTILALTSGKDKILASRGNITKNDLQSIPEDVYAKTRKFGHADFIYKSSASTNSQFLQDFDSTIFHLTYFKPLDWYIIAAAPLSELQATSNIVLRRLGIIAISTMLLAFFITSFFAYRFAKPLRTLTQKVQDVVEQGMTEQITTTNYADFCKLLHDLSEELPQNDQGEVGQLAKAFNQMGLALADNIQNLMQTQVITERMQGELDAGREIQMGILPPPHDIPSVKHYDIAAFLEPAKEVGGDLYDYFTAPDNKQCIVIGDVSGKGVAAALFMSVTVTLVRYAIASGFLPHMAMSQINNMLNKNNTSCMFVTLFIGLFDPNTGNFEYANGGHCAPLFLRNNGEIECSELVSGPMLGVFNAIPYTEGTTRLEQGETCFLYSDGVSEAMDKNHELYGEERLQAVLQKNRQLNPMEMIDAVYNGILEHRGEAEPSDDIAIICFKRTT